MAREAEDIDFTRMCIGCRSCAMPMLELRRANPTCKLTHLSCCPADLIADGGAQLRNLTLQRDGIGVHGSTRQAQLAAQSLQ